MSILGDIISKVIACHRFGGSVGCRLLAHLRPRATMPTALAWLTLRLRASRQLPRR